MNRLEQTELEQLDSYDAIRLWRDKTLPTVVTNHQQLNDFHEKLMLRVSNLAIANIKSEWGEPPAHFAFFLMGSAARREQSVWSDQDHGIIFKEDSEKAREYFLALGQELTKGFEAAGYALCDGRVMASNPLWCKSLYEWKVQLKNWMDKASWTTIRHLLTFFDSRVLVGEKEYLVLLKSIIFKEITQSPTLLKRMLDNVGRINKVIGAFGQLLVETKGEHTGKIHLKNAAFFPFVNSVRLLAIQEQIKDPSTLSRIHQLPEEIRKNYESDFQTLLDYRVKMQRDKQTYDDVHYLDVESLDAEEKKELKRILKSGYHLHHETKKRIKKGCSSSW